MIKKNRNIIVLTSVVILLPMLAGLILWKKLPDEVATHFSMEGLADSFSHKSFAVFGIPVFLLAMQWICFLASLSDSKIKNMDSKIFKIVLWICPAVSLLTGGVVYSFALDVKFSISSVFMIFFGLFFIVIGNYLPKCRQNYSLGIRLPWTLNDEDNWNYTHRLAGRLWVAGGVILILSSFTKQFWLFAVVTVLMIAIPVAGSFIYTFANNNHIRF